MNPDNKLQTVSSVTFLGVFNDMTNIIDKKNKVRELVNQSSLCKLMGLQEKFLRGIDNLPDEANEEEEKALDMLQKVIQLSEDDSDMQETVKTFLRLDEIVARKHKDPDAPIDDLLKPIT